MHVTSAVKLFTHAVSLGGVDSLVQHPAALTHRPVAPEARPAAGIIRLSIGLEDKDDLIRDLDQALSGLRDYGTHAPSRVTPKARSPKISG